MHWVAAMVSIGLAVVGANGVSGQGYPNKPIRIVTAPVGGGDDFSARLIAQGLAGPLGQQLIVDNRGGGLVHGEIVARAPPDGYTLLFSGPFIWIGTLLRSGVTYDPVRDFSPLSTVATSPNVLVVHPTVAAHSVKELIALAKSRPGELNYASGPGGSINHLAAELFKSMAGVNIVRVAYKGGGPAATGLLSGEVQMLFGSSGSVIPHVKAGRLRALAVTSAQPSVLAPGLPTVAASGLPGYESVSLDGLLAPAGTPTAILNRLSQDVAQALSKPDLKEKFLNSGVEPVASSPQHFAAAIKADLVRMSKVIKDAGIRAD